MRGNFKPDNDTDGNGFVEINADEATLTALIYQLTEREDPLKFAVLNAALHYFVNFPDELPGFLEKVKNNLE